MAKILLLNPLTRAVSFSRQPGEAYPQLGLGYIASYLRKNNVEVEILDANALKVSYARLKENIRNSGAQVVGITAMTPTIYYALAAARIAKEAGCKVVLGGIHPSIFFDGLIRLPEVDYIVRGEGEITMLELAYALEGKKELKEVKGLVFKEGESVFVNAERDAIADLDSLPFPAWDLMPVRKYRIVTALKEPCLTMLISRGCVFKCVHCSSQIIFKRSLRTRSAKNVADEMEMLVKEHKVKYIYFIDYCFTVNRKLILEFCAEIQRRGLKVMWWAEGRADTVDKQLLSAMKEAGCHSFTFGVESGSQDILDNLRRGMSLEQIRNAVKTAKEVGLRVETNFMFGSPGETLESASKTIEFAIELDANEAQFSIFTPYPGTEYFAVAKQKGLIPENAFQEYADASKLANTYFPDKVSFKSENLDAQELQKIFRTAHRKYYIRPRYIFRNIPFYLFNPLQFKRLIFAAISMLRILVKRNFK